VKAGEVDMKAMAIQSADELDRLPFGPANIEAGDHHHDWIRAHLEHIIQKAREVPARLPR
jgi:hypothetical protein